VSTRVSIVKLLPPLCTMAALLAPVAPSYRKMMTTIFPDVGAAENTKSASASPAP